MDAGNGGHFGAERRAGSVFDLRFGSGCIAAKLRASDDQEGMTVDQSPHQPVMLSEAVEGLAIKAEGVYVDGTFGRGGHSRAILERIGGKGRLVALDLDPEAVGHARHFLSHDPRFSIIQGSFGDLRAVMDGLSLTGRIDGLLLDLGLSSPQLDNGRRGFSFMNEGPLDMRYDPQSQPSAAEWLARASAREIEQVLRDLGEERYARRIAGAMVRERANGSIDTTRKLAELVASAMPRREKGQHPATRTFQAIRIHINREIEALQRCLHDSVEVLAKGGRLAVISFHSLEDRAVKRHLRGQKQVLPSKLPIRNPVDIRPMRTIGKAQFPTAAEQARNRRARSAVLRVAERI
jgi:16S rRNA (cytosine1402-N4)-methyltransferase